MNKHFSISYQQQYPEQVTIDQSYSNKFLGLGFKKIVPIYKNVIRLTIHLINITKRWILF